MEVWCVVYAQDVRSSKRSSKTTHGLCLNLQTQAMRLQTQRKSLQTQ